MKAHYHWELVRVLIFDLYFESRHILDIKSSLTKSQKGVVYLNGEL